jgi:predicted RNA polymerase sigma factor
MLESYHLLYAVLAEFESRLNDYQAAARHLRKALEFTDLPSEQFFLSQKLQAYEARR